MTVVLTGASGFIGQNLVNAIQQKNPGSIVSLNLRQEPFEKLPAATALIHLAGKAHDLKNAANPQAYMDVNYGLTKKLFDEFLKSDIKDFIYFSSVKAVADTVEGSLKENRVPDPKTPYGQSKLKAETYLLSKDIPEGKRLFILRPCMIHGPGNKGNLNLLYKVVKSGIPYPLGAFNNSRSFLSIDNLLFIIEQILRKPSVQGGVYNLADDKPLSTSEVIKIIGEASNRKAKIWNISPKVISLLAKIGDKTYFPLNSERLKKLTESYIVSNSKIKQALDIQEFPVSSRDGLLQTIKGFN